MWQFELWTKGKANNRSKIQNGKYGINVVSYLLCLHVEDMWCTILKETNVFIIEWMWISCRIEMIEQSPKRVEIGTHKNPYWKRRHEKMNFWRLTFIWVVSFSSRDNVLLWRRISLLWLLSLWLPLRLLPQRSRLWLPFWLCRCLREWSRLEWQKQRNMRVFDLTSLLRAPPPSDGAELMADPGRLPDSEPEILLVQRQREYWSGTCHSCGWCRLDWGSTRGAALGLNSKSLLSTLLSREWS